MCLPSFDAKSAQTFIIFDKLFVYFGLFCGFLQCSCVDSKHTLNQELFRNQFIVIFEFDHIFFVEQCFPKLFSGCISRVLFIIDCQFWCCRKYADAYFVINFRELAFIDFFWAWVDLSSLKQLLAGIVALISSLMDSILEVEFNIIFKSFKNGQRNRTLSNS